MSLPKVTIRRAKREDVKGIDSAHAPSMKVWCGEVDGKIIGYGGFYISKGRWVGFCDLTEEALRYKVSFIRIAREAMNEMKNTGHKRIYAELDPKFPMARRWVESLGFRPERTGLWLWRK